MCVITCAIPVLCMYSAVLNVVQRLSSVVLSFSVFSFICFSTFCFFCPLVCAWSVSFLSAQRFLAFSGVHHYSSSEAWGGGFSLPLGSGDLASILTTPNTDQHTNVAFCVMQVGNPRVELTLSELQDMAARQQQQIENQQQMLVAKVIIIYRS